jgi:glycosyltransferase involved in cell wall biosynthesis
MISCLAGQSLDVLRTEIPTLVVCHDYYPFCAAFHICFEGVCRECGPARLAECFARNEHNTLVRQAGAAHWAAVRENFVQTMTARRIPMAAPSQAVVENLTRLEPRLAGPHFQVIPHGIDTAAFPPLWAVKHERLRGVVLGRLTPEKGGDLLWEALSGLGQCCDVALLGCQDAGQRFAGMPHVTMLPQYDLRELPALLARHQPDFGMVLSVCPETFCYTLSEMMCLGIPPVATRLGGPAERIQHGVNGFLCEPTAADLLRTVRGLVEEPERLARVRRNLARVRHRTLEEMVAEYHAILSVPTFCEARYLRGNGEVRGAAAPLLLPAAALPPTAGELIEQAAREETFAQLVKRVYAIAEWKVARTPQLSRWQRRIAGMVLHGGWQMLKIGKRISRIGPRRKAA